MKKMKKFKEFLNENKTEKTFEEFIKNIKTAVKKDFSSTSDYADEFVILYNDELVQSWKAGYTTREAIAATQVPGVKISDDKVDESLILTIDDNYENSYQQLNDLKKSQKYEAIEIIEDYFETYDKKNISDKRIFERTKNNYKSLINLYEKKFK